MTGLLENYADLVAIGTIGDVVPLLGENRVLVRAGLPHLSRSDRLGLRALLENASLDNRELTAANVAFGIVPRAGLLPRTALSASCSPKIRRKRLDWRGMFAIATITGGRLRAISLSGF